MISPSFILSPLEIWRYVQLVYRNDTRIESQWSTRREPQGHCARKETGDHRIKFLDPAVKRSVKKENICLVRKSEYQLHRQAALTHKVFRSSTHRLRKGEVVRLFALKHRKRVPEIPSVDTNKKRSDCTQACVDLALFHYASSLGLARPMSVFTTLLTRIISAIDLANR